MQSPLARIRLIYSIYIHIYPSIFESEKFIALLILLLKCVVSGGRPLLELNRVLRPGGFFVWSATPVYQQDEGHRNVWKS